MQDSHGRLATYLNPVYSRSFPDPFILKFRGEYFAYSTGFAPDGKVFMTLRSSDLVTWTEIGGAMTPLPDSPPFYWAPEVSYSNGKFYLYYSVGNETFMEIRLAISGRPDGGFTDSGTKLTSEDFAIDAHVFLDQDGTRYFFYATDFLEHSHIGTGTVVDRMVDWKTLEGNSHPVTRAKYDWQVYDHNRKEKGGVRWHTVEGPAVLKRKGLYYEMFSGGNWQNTTYGVSFAIADSLERGDEWAQFSDGVNVLPVLRTIPGVVDGPGHNSVVRGPNNRELYCVYHRWVDGARVLAIDRMDFAGDRIFVVGPTNAPQPLPLPPSIRERFIGRISSDRIAIRGDWRFDKQGIVSVADGRCEMRLETISQSFLLELTLAFSDIAAAGGDAGVIFETASASATINLDLTRRSVEIASNATSRTFDFPPELDWTADHFVRIECDHRWFRIKVDDLIVCPWSMLEAPVDRITIFSENSPLMMGSLELTEGFEELFEDDTALEDNGWSFQSGGNYQRAPGEIRFHERDFRIGKGPALTDLEVAANFRMESTTSPGEFRISLIAQGGDAFHVSVSEERSSLEIGGLAVRSFPLPANLDLTQYHQVRIMKLGGHAICYFDDAHMGDFTVTEGPVRASIAGGGSLIAIEMIRLTAVGNNIVDSHI